MKYNMLVIIEGELVAVHEEIPKQTLITIAKLLNLKDLPISPATVTLEFVDVNH